MKKEKGFTLIELCIVTAIISILATIAISQYSSYRVKALDANAISVLKSAGIAQEGYFTDNQVYATKEEEWMLSNYGFTPSPSVSFDIVFADGTRYLMEASHTSSDNTYETTGATIVLKQ